MCICVQAGGCLLYFVLIVIMMSYLSNIIGGVNLLERERERERERKRERDGWHDHVPNDSLTYISFR